MINEDNKTKQAKDFDIDIEISNKFLEKIKTGNNFIIHVAPTIDHVMPNYTFTI